MKAFSLFSFVLASALLISCGEEVCIQCTPIEGDTTTMEELCSADQNERMDFQVEWTDKLYNCVQVESASTED